MRYGTYHAVKVSLLSCPDKIYWMQVGSPVTHRIIESITTCAGSSSGWTDMNSSLSECDAQWERPSWLFSVRLPASSCSVPVLRKPALLPRRPGRHNTTACEREGPETETERDNGTRRAMHTGVKQSRREGTWGCRIKEADAVASDIFY